MKPDDAIWRGRSVLITGHTGFKGSWLTMWLHQLGADVHGYALDPPTLPNLFEVARVKTLLTTETRADLASLDRLQSTFNDTRPQVVFHLAAQPLVRESYMNPLGTFATNVLGTAHVLEASRVTDSVHAVIVITTDKVYDNNESGRAYRETDALGGHDPYSASKAAAELIAASYRDSFFATAGHHPARVATARAGNVLGGGDWAVDRLIPDCFRAFATGKSVQLRYPNSVRPWQHVLDPLFGYIRLAEKLLAVDGGKFASAWNFGPDVRDESTVAEVAVAAARLWGNGACVEKSLTEDHEHESRVLRLDNTRARTLLGWNPRWSLQQALEKTVSWQRSWADGSEMAPITASQIQEYENAPQ